ncbi:TetR/AcrR family transcriptional regulator [Micromonospora sp. KLBMP9576]|uniref:TetR/AcrR family transcriptional regulator n=1 Tax=Micromonospora sp. KLBMP9576 TaxID=3424769 RepID=UPI003D92D0A2
MRDDASTDTDGRAKRRDATRNRDRLLAAARAVFAEHGHDVALEEIARVAQVSRATLYRNFASREALAATIYADNLGHIEKRAAELADRPAGVLDLFEFVLDMQLSNRSVGSVLSRADTALFANLAARTADAFRPLARAGSRAGVLRPGIELDDLLLAVLMAEVSVGETDPALRGREHTRRRTILRHGLFTDRAVAAFEAERGTAAADPP